MNPSSCTTQLPSIRKVLPEFFKPRILTAIPAFYNTDHASSHVHHTPYITVQQFDTSTPLSPQLSIASSVSSSGWPEVTELTDCSMSHSMGPASTFTSPASAGSGLINPPDHPASPDSFRDTDDEDM
ncbi:hypothetical protein FRB90_000378, partial [Tulasnella sp. 427]